jgi:hypothetical protein
MWARSKLLIWPPAGSDRRRLRGRTFERTARQRHLQTIGTDPKGSDARLTTLQFKPRAIAGQPKCARFRGFDVSAREHCPK